MSEADIFVAYVFAALVSLSHLSSSLSEPGFCGEHQGASPSGKVMIVHILLAICFPTFPVSLAMRETETEREKERDRTTKLFFVADHTKKVSS